jgi:hypothetical protein
VRRSWYFGVGDGCDGKELKYSEEHVVVDAVIYYVYWVIEVVQGA